MIILLSWKRNGGSEMLSNLSQVTQIAHGTTRFQTLPCGTLKASMSSWRRASKKIKSANNQLHTGN